MFIHKKKPWQLSEKLITPEDVYLNRRQWLMGAGLASLSLGLSASKALAALDLPKFDQPITDENEVTSYVNFYEFGSHKTVAPLAQKLSTRPWKIDITGLVDNPMSLDVDDLIKKMPIEERITRHRCVEAWAFIAPWRGFALKELLKIVQPQPEARYVKFITKSDDESMPGLSQFWYPWPYVEGLTIEEANNDLAFLATGLYGKDLQPQNGAPIRLVVPWKYGFKSIKSIVEIAFTDKQPVSFWEEVQGSEYGFWANVHPEVPHKRWSQASHRMLGTNERVATMPYNGYRNWVAELYPDVDPVSQPDYFF